MTDRPTLDQEQDLYRVLYYGDPGLGKTTAIASAAKLGKIVYVDSENGLKGKALKQFGVPISNIEPHRDVSYDGLTKLHHELLLRLAEGEEIYAVVIDTVTKAQGALINEVVDAAVEKAERTGKERSELDTYVEDYGTVATMMRRLIRRYHDLPCHVIIGAHQRRNIDKDEGTIQIGPALTPSVATDLVGYMDCVIHMRTETFGDELEYSGLTQPRGRFVAKDRFNLLPPVMVNPSFDRVVSYLDEELTRDKDPLQKAARDRRTKPKAEEKPT